MEILPEQPTVTGPAQVFTGNVHFNVIARGEEPSRVPVNTVRFAPCARTAWHAHALGQTLHVTDGVGLVQARGGEVVLIRPGDMIWTPPGEWHWHGAAPDQFMVHTAIWEGDEAEWGDLVTDGVRLPATALTTGRAVAGSRGLLTRDPAGLGFASASVSRSAGARPASRRGGRVHAWAAGAPPSPCWAASGRPPAR
jgi:quercetin dioxygenase-like cupin family protein